MLLVVGEDNSRCGSIALAALDRLGTRHGVCCGGADRVEVIGVGDAGDVAADGERVVGQVVGFMDWRFHCLLRGRPQSARTLNSLSAL